MKTKYTNEELVEFKQLILSKLLAAEQLFLSLKETLSKKNNGTDDTGWTFNMMEDGQATLSAEETTIMAQKQEKFICALKAALERIENKSYGTCTVTGELIPKGRLLAVPHATTGILQKQRL